MSFAAALRSVQTIPRNPSRFLPRGRFSLGSPAETLPLYITRNQTSIKSHPMIFPTYVCFKNNWIFFLTNVFLVNINKIKKNICKFLKGFWNSRNIHEIEKIRRWKKISQKTPHLRIPGVFVFPPKNSHLTGLMPGQVVDLKKAQSLPGPPTPFQLLYVYI